MDLHLQLCEENVLCRVMTQIGEDLEETGGRERGNEEMRGGEKKGAWRKPEVSHPTACQR